MSHDIEVKGDHIIGAAQGSTWMSTLALVDHTDDVASHLAADAFEFLDIRHDREVGFD